MWRSMNMWLLLTALLYFAVGGARGNYAKEENHGICIYNNDTIISPGETVKASDSCAEVLCENANGDVVVLGCAAVAPPDGCEWTGQFDPLTSFPKCCAENVQCVNGINDEQRKQLQEIWSSYSPDLKVPQGGACKKKRD